MEIKELSLPITNPLVADYVGGGEVSSFFEYDIQDQGYGKKRLEDLRSRSFKREELCNYLLAYHQGFDVSEQTIENIKKIGDDDTYVVVGGQQAGLLTGPLFAIHKVISIIQLAKKHEKELGVPVVPVFWIAGEDHDIDEINHVHMLSNKKVRKKILFSRERKKIATETILDKEQCQKWIEDIFTTYGETEYTKDVLAFLQHSLEKNMTYVTFFASLVLHLFREEGLVVIDSGCSTLRKLESSYFVKMIKNHLAISETFVSQQKRIEESGYKPLIETKETCSHLFIHVDGERFLLERVSEDAFQTKDGGIKISYDELLGIAEQTPERLSNNVVTRPLMQELLLPTLSFIAGPGEIAYWAELKGVFEANGVKMPPVVPRQNITVVERSVKKAIDSLGLTVEEVLLQDIQELREQWLEQRLEFPIEEKFNAAKDEIRLIHEQLRHLAVNIDSSLGQVAHKNQIKIMEQIVFLQQLIDKSISRKHEVELEKFRIIEQSLRPLHAPQERIWNVFYYINQYGFEVISTIVNSPLEWNGQHKVINI